MRKTQLLILVFLILVPPICFGESHQNTGLDQFLEKHVGKDISVALSTIDLKISGTLLAIYPDGILLKTQFHDELYILKSAIAYCFIKKIQKN